jgi:hypothetical protein
MTDAGKGQQRSQAQKGQVGSSAAIFLSDKARDFACKGAYLNT